MLVVVTKRGCTRIHTDKPWLFNMTDYDKLTIRDADNQLSTGLNVQHTVRCDLILAVPETSEPWRLQPAPTHIMRKWLVTEGSIAPLSVSL